MSGEIDAGNRGRCLRAVCLIFPADAVTLIRSRRGRETSAVNGLAPEVLRGQDGHAVKWTM
jgi:hypothetical protein